MVADNSFVHRVAAYPVVVSAWQRANACYDWAKASSGYVRSAAEATESGLRRAADSAGPLLRGGRLEDGVASLDQLACRQLDRLEARCPAVRAPTEELVESTYGYYASSVKPKVELVLSPVSAAVAKAQSAKEFGLAQYRRLSGGSEELAAWAERYVDLYLPEEGSSSMSTSSTSSSASQEEQETATTTSGGGALVRKLQRRLLDRAAAARAEFAARLELAEQEAAAAADADAVAAVKLAAAAGRRAQAVSRAGLEFAAARVPELDSLPVAGRLAGLLSVYTREQLLFDPFDPENRRHLLLSAANGEDDNEGDARVARQPLLSNGCRGNDPTVD